MDEKATRTTRFGLAPTMSWVEANRDRGCQQKKTSHEPRVVFADQTGAGRSSPGLQKGES
jgi:hypothetical protein